MADDDRRVRPGGLAASPAQGPHRSSGLNQSLSDVPAASAPPERPAPGLTLGGGQRRVVDDETIFDVAGQHARIGRSEAHTSELQSLMRNSYAVFCLKKKH